MRRRRLAKIGRRKAANALRDYKRRLHGVLRVIGGSGATRAMITARLNAGGCPVSQSSVTRWMTATSRAVPDAYQLIVIGDLAGDVSLDWLFGRRGAESMTEQYIESQVRRWAKR
jgi:hypothetical protein